MGRRQKPYRTSWNELIDGLNWAPDGRWKIVATGEQFTGKDEFTAVSRFKQRAADRNAVFILARLERGKPKGWNVSSTVANVTPPDTATAAEAASARAGYGFAVDANIAESRSRYEQGPLNFTHGPCSSG